MVSLRRLLAILVCVLAFLCLAWGQEKSSPEFLNSLDQRVDPCTDFYRFACGNWHATLLPDPPPPSWGAFNEIAQRTRMQLRDVLEKAAEPRPNRKPARQRLGDYYAACMDQSAGGAESMATLREELRRIDDIRSTQDLGPAIAHLWRLGTAGIVRTYVFRDRTELSSLAIDSGALVLPYRSYYEASDARSTQLRDKYRDTMREVFQLMGDAPAAAQRRADAVFAFEKRLAAISLDLAARRAHPVSATNPSASTALSNAVHAIDWVGFWREMGAAPAEVHLADPDYLNGLDAVLRATDLDDIRSYLKWRLVALNSDFLPPDYGNRMSQWDREARGLDQPPRWQTCVNDTDRDLGESLGEVYVEMHFVLDSNERVNGLARQLKQSLEDAVRNAAWMTPATRQAALSKVAAIKLNVGYPEVWFENNVQITRKDALANHFASQQARAARDLSYLGQPRGGLEWAMSMPTVNAYYNPSGNGLFFPPGLMQPPVYDEARNAALNYGALGAIMGHELTHAVDETGSRYDASGRFNRWWTDDDERNFGSVAGCIKQQYGDYKLSEGTPVNGTLTSGENIGDLSGLELAYSAYQKAKLPAAEDHGFTPDQLFFIGWAQTWCGQATPEREKLAAQTDPHAPRQFRVNGVVSNIPEFRSAFRCGASAPMVRTYACRVW